MKGNTAPAETVDAYIASAPKNVQPVLSELRALIRKAAPQATEKISYRMPTFYYNGNLVHFAVYARHIGFYPTPSAIVEFEKELTKYRTSKGAIQFPIGSPLPAELISRIVKFRVKENEKRGIPPS